MEQVHVLSKCGKGHQLLVFNAEQTDRSNGFYINQKWFAKCLQLKIPDTRMHFLKMNGREIFKSAVRVMERAVRELFEKHGVRKDEVTM